MVSRRIRGHIRNFSQHYEHVILGLTIAVLLLDIASAWVADDLVSERVDRALNTTALVAAIATASYQWAHRRNLNEALLTVCLVATALYFRATR
jgi:hypothetical protein